MASSVLIVFVVALWGITSATRQVTAREQRCMSEGRYPHPDCGSYFECISDQEGGFFARVGSCKGQAFDPIFKKCVSLSKMPGCTPRDARSIASDPKLDFVCEGASSEFVCADCKTLVNCVNGTAYPEPCGAGDFCARKEAQFGGGVCYPGEPEQCACQKPNEFLVDYYDETRFIFCGEEGTDPIIYQCPEDHVFDQTMSQCRNYDGLPECTRIGVFANSDNCTQYYTCIFSTNGWVQKPFACNSTTFMYNEVTGVCEDPCEWSQGEFTCSEEGRFPDPRSCNRYYECVTDADQDSGFRQALHECPEKYVWDESAKGDFGHCVLQGTSKTPCNPVTSNKCKIPEDQCSTDTAF